MKNKIVFKLSSYFVTALLLFALIIGSIFIILFRSYTIELNKENLVERATKIAETLSTITTTGNGKDQGSGYGMYIKFINDIAMTDVWIVDSDLNIITYGINQHSISTTSELPTNAETIVEKVFAGETEYSEDFSNLFDVPTITVGTPIKSSDGTIIGVVLLHSPVDGIDTVINKGIIILGVSISIALIIAVLLSFGLSLSFTKPLKKINRTAILLAAGNYQAKTDIDQKDEIGMLATNMDKLAVQLDNATKESARLEKMRQDFVANISHELRTPITVIRGSLEALNDGVVTNDKQVKEYYQQMLSESKNLQRLVGDLLDLSKLQNLDFKLEMQEISIVDVINDSVRSAEKLAAHKQININFENKVSDTVINGDYGRLRQMIMIIIDNAIKFSPSDSHIQITLTNKDALTLSIKDEGIGISENDLPYIFDRFQKTNSNENLSGSGLGLAIAKQIAIRHDITIVVTSEVDKGTEFIFRFKDLPKKTAN